LNSENSLDLRTFNLKL